MTPLNYEIKNSFLFPFSYGKQHLQNAFIKNKASLKNRCVHLVLGITEMIPVVNYIIAIADRIFHPAWIWDLAYSKIPNFESLPVFDQTDIPVVDSGKNEKYHGLGIGINDEKFYQKINRPMTFWDKLAMQRPYPWYYILETDDTLDGCRSALNARNFEIINRAKPGISRGIINNEKVLFVKTPTKRPSKEHYYDMIGQVFKKAYEGDEVSIIFKDGRCINIFINRSEHLSTISRMPEKSPGLIDSIIT